MTTSGVCYGGPWDGHEIVSAHKEIAVALYKPIPLRSPDDPIDQTIDIGRYVFKRGFWIWEGPK